MMLQGDDGTEQEQGERPQLKRSVSRREALQNYNEGSLHSRSDVADYRKSLSKLIGSWAFESGVGFIILGNMALAWYETDLTAAPNTAAIPMWLRVSNIFISILYAGEVALRITVMQREFFRYFFSWDTFDLFLVVSDVILLILQAFLDVQQNAAIRALRIGRSLRVVKAIRVWPAFRELYVMMHGLIGAFKAMLWSAVLLFLVLTLFGIIAVEVIHPLVLEIADEGDFEGCKRCDRAFSTVWNSMVTFFQQIVVGDSWGQVTIPVMENFLWTCPFFVLVVVTVQFGIMNLILVAIVDQANKSSNEDAQFQARTRKEEFEAARSQLLAVCKMLDADESGEISLEELMTGYETMPELANQLRFLDVKKEDMTILFSALDSDGSGSVAYEEFVEQLFSMQNQDAGVLLAFIRSYVQDIRKQVSESREQVLNARAEIEEVKELVRSKPLPVFQTETVEMKTTTTCTVSAGTSELNNIQERHRAFACKADTALCIPNIEALVNFHLQALELIRQSCSSADMDKLEALALAGRFPADAKIDIQASDPKVEGEAGQSEQTRSESLADAAMVGHEDEKAVYAVAPPRMNPHSSLDKLQRPKGRGVSSPLRPLSETDADPPDDLQTADADAKEGDAGDLSPQSLECSGKILGI
eukprot:TRINITY_DN42978_c0_g1_i1.p1 TRINITY_DN42978_c0_g1~~TRINITY_DN42978_c0_g1_i1.p1  ORF type:complete len:667 (-),score=140.58 TRINITY_DN42978_c0_g1_i1:55-1989(-)